MNIFPIFHSFFCRSLVWSTTTLASFPLFQNSETQPFTLFVVSSGSVQKFWNTIAQHHFMNIFLFYWWLSLARQMNWIKFVHMQVPEEWREWHPLLVSTNKPQCTTSTNKPQVPEIPTGIQYHQCRPLHSVKMMTIKIMMMHLGRTTPITKNYLDTEYVDREVSLGERKRDMHVTWPCDTFYSLQCISHKGR